MFGRGWTHPEIKIAAELRKLGHTYQEIGERLSRPPGSVKSTLIRNRLVPTVKEAALKRETMKKLLGEIQIHKGKNQHVVSSVDVPDYVLAERDKRLNEYRSPAQILMGEPPPSQSALARPPRGGLIERRESVTD